MRTILWTVLPAGVILASVSTAHAAALTDDFNDNTTGPQWSVLADNPAQLSVAEQNSRLELLSSGPTDANTDALYLSNGPSGFLLSTAQDFHITLDYSFTNYQSVAGPNEALALDFGVGRDLDGTDSAAIGFGYAAASLGAGTIVLPGGLVAHRTDDNQTTDAESLASPTSGTFDIAYAAATDDLTLSIAGGSLSYTLSGTVKGIWGANDLFVSFGGRGDGFTTASGDAWLDNFNVISGQLDAVPEPAVSGLIAFAAMALPGMRRRRRR